MKTYISDETYMKFSKLAYQDVSEGFVLPELEPWKVVEPEGAELHNKVSGFDALVLQNEQTDQIVIGYRGTEPGGNWFDMGADYETDVFDVLGGRTRRLEDAVTDPDHHNIFKKALSKRSRTILNGRTTSFAKRKYSTRK